MNGIGFGPGASMWAARVTSPIALVATEPESAFAALQHGYELRLRGEPYYASVVLPDRTAWWLQQRMGEVFAAYPTLDRWRRILDGVADGSLTLNGKSLAESATISPDAREFVRDFIALSNGLAVRSWEEYARLRALVGPIRRAAFVANAPADNVPAPREGKRERIVVWAPDVPVSGLVPHLSVLSELDVPATIVCGTGNAQVGGVDWVLPAQAGDVLADARVIVDASLTDPASACALAAWQRPLVADASSGVTEFVDGVHLYAAQDRDSLNYAVQDALGGRPPSPPVIPPPRFPQTAEAIPDDPPLISVCIATRNRRSELAAALASVEAQRYPKLEIIVVNDAGERVADVVARAPRARLIENEWNIGCFPTFNVAMREARGEWIAFLDDDDLWFPDHLERMLAAGLRANKRVVCGQAIVRAVRRSEGAIETASLRIPLQAAYDRSKIAAMCTIVTPARMIHRSILDDVGYYDPSITSVADYEYCVRLSKVTSFARVDEVTSVYTVSLQAGQNLSAIQRTEIPADHERIWERYPADGDVYVAALREAILKNLREGKAWQFTLFEPRGS